MAGLCVLGDVREALLCDAVDHELLLGGQARDRAAGVESRLDPGLIAEIAYLAVQRGDQAVIVKVRDISDRLARSGARDPLYDVPHSTGHTGFVHGGTALNIVPDVCSFEFEFRSIAQDNPVVTIDEDDPHVSPMGAKGIGEVGIVGTAAAIANAVYHAMSIRIRDLPITLDKLLS